MEVEVKRTLALEEVQAEAVEEDSASKASVLGPPHQLRTLAPRLVAGHNALHRRTLS